MGHLPYGGCPKQVVFCRVGNRQKEMTTGALVKELMVAVAFFM